MKYLVIAIIALTVAANSSMAFALDTKKPYIKTSVGRFKFDDTFNGSYADTNGNLVFVEVDDETIALDTNVGFPFNDNVAIEGGFFYLTETDWERGVEGQTMSGSSVRTIHDTGNLDGYALTVAMVSRFPVSSNFDVLGKFGVYRLELTYTNWWGPGLSTEIDDTDVLVGFGLDFRVNRLAFFVIGYDVYSDVGNFAHIGVRFNP